MSELGATAFGWASQIGVDGLAAPERLLWLLLLAAAALAFAGYRRLPSLHWPGMGEAAFAGGTRREPAEVLALVLRGLVLVLLAVALAEPFGERRAPPAPGLGLDLILTLDTSGSMRALDTQYGREAATRLDLAKRVVRRFAARRVEEGDRVGLVVFGENAFTQSPLTSDQGLLRAAVGRVGVGMAGETTALGDALALAVKRASAADDPTGRVVVLLTDGQSNAGTVPVDVAIGLAKHFGVRVHTVGIGTSGEQVPMAARSAGGGGPLRFERHDADLETLERIAMETGGRFYPARRAVDLAPVYEAIDGLERRARPLERRVRRRPNPETFLAGAGGLLVAEIALVRILRRRLP